MAEDIFLKLEKVKGGSEVKGMEQQLGLTSWSWGVSQTGSMHETTGGGKGKSSFQDISCTMLMDRGVIELLQHCSVGEHLATATLVQRKSASKDEPLKFVEIELKHIIVSSVMMSGSGEDSSVSFSLNFSEFKMTYRSQTNKGGKKDEPEFSYNIATVEKK